MKRIRVFTILTLLAFSSTLLGCANMPSSVPEEHKGAAIGAGIGALTGVLIGGTTVRGAIIGGLLGALAGGAIGHYVYDQRKDRTATAETYGYQASQGVRLSIEDVSTQPRTIKGGEVIDLLATYAILTPSENTQTKVTEIRTITHNGKSVGNPEITVDRKGGTYTSTVPLRLPPNADKGVYVVRTTIETPNAKDTRETTFKVL